VCCDFVDNSYVRDSYISVLQSLSVLNEDVTDVIREPDLSSSEWWHRSTDRNIYERRQP
jgi:hypothetical protein